MHIVSTVFSKNHITSTVFYRILQYSRYWPLQARWRGPQSTPYCVPPPPRLEIRHCRKSSRIFQKLSLTAHLILSLVLIWFRTICLFAPHKAQQKTAKIISFFHTIAVAVGCIMLEKSLLLSSLIVANELTWL